MIDDMKYLLADGRTIYIKCKVDKEGADWLLRQMYANDKPTLGLTIDEISWDKALINNYEIKQIIEKLEGFLK